MLNAIMISFFPEEYKIHEAHLCYSDTDNTYIIECQGNSLIWAREAILGYSFQQTLSIPEESIPSQVAPVDAACSPNNPECTVPFGAFWARCNARKSCDLSDITFDVQTSPCASNTSLVFATRPTNFLHLYYSCIPGNVDKLAPVLTITVAYQEIFTIWHLYYSCILPVGNFHGLGLDQWLPFCRRYFQLNVHNDCIFSNYWIILLNALNILNTIYQREWFDCVYMRQRVQKLCLTCLSKCSSDAIFSV